MSKKLNGKAKQKARANRTKKSNSSSKNTFNGAMVVSDVTLALVNNNITEIGAIDIMKNLHKAEGFSVVVPRKYTDYIKCDFNVNTSMWTDLAEKSPLEPCFIAYKETDTVIVTSYMKETA